MTRWERRLYRLYINAAVTFLIVLIPSFLRRSAEYAELGRQYHELASQQREMAGRLAAQPPGPGDAPRETVGDGSFRASPSPVDAEELERKGEEWIRQRDLRAARDLLPWWALGAAAPWGLHFGIRWLLRRSESSAPGIRKEPDRSHPPRARDQPPTVS